MLLLLGQSHYVHVTQVGMWVRLNLDMGSLGNIAEETYQLRLLQIGYISPQCSAFLFAFSPDQCVDDMLRVFKENTLLYCV